KNMSQQQLADDIHTNRAYLSKVENGISTPSVKLGVQIAEVLGINVEDIFFTDSVRYERRCTKHSDKITASS
ncbi:DNA-binding helix-turn-helix protein, partial [Lentilactobacillus buchneri ATCC 11577]